MVECLPGVYEVLDSTPSTVILDYFQIIVIILQGIQVYILKLHVRGLEKWCCGQEHLLHGCEGLSSNARHPHEKLGVTEPVTSELGSETGGSLGLAGH